MLEGLKAEVEKLRDVDPAALRDPTTIIELNRLMASLDAINTRATAAFDTAREWEASGSRTAGAWLRTACRLPIATARRRVRLGRALRHLPAAEQAWLEGDISDSHVLALEGVRTEKTEEQLARDEKMLVDDARILNFSHFIMVLSYWAQHADPDGPEDKAIERVVFDSPSRVIDVGVAQRLFTGATRRAIEVRDRQCYHEFCEEPGSRCQVDHIQPYSAGGPTTTKNGRLACGFHNRRRNRGP